MEQLPVKVEAVVGTALITNPWWIGFVDNLGHTFSMVAAFCGMLIGLHTLYRIWKGRR